MTYRVIKDEGGYKIVEKDTQHVVDRVVKEKPARELCRDLNLGAGFAGWTPEFFCQNFK